MNSLINEAAIKQPVIVVPGIMGRWPDPMQGGKLVLDPILHSYDGLVRALQAVGYVDG